MSMVYVDYDDVLCETARQLLRLAEQEFGKRIAFADVFSFNLEESLGLSAPEIDRLMRLAHEPAVLGAMNPTAHAAKALRRWARRGLEIAVVTGRPPATEPACREWLERHAIPYSRLLFVDKYGRFPHLPAEAPVVPMRALPEMDFRVAVEDSLDMVRFLAEQGRFPVVIFDRPWNASGLDAERDGAGRVVRCRGWAEIMRRFEGRI